MSFSLPSCENHEQRGMLKEKLKFKFGSVFTILFFSMVALLSVSGIYLVYNGAHVLKKAEEQRALMNRQQRIVDELLFDATQIQDLLVSGLLSDNQEFKRRQKQRYDEAMLVNSQRIDTLQTLHSGVEQEAAFDRMIAARNANTEVRERIISYCLAGSDEAIHLYNDRQRDLNKEWINSISEYGSVLRTYDEAVLSEFQGKANRLIHQVSLSYLSTGMLLVLLTGQVYVNGKKTVRLANENKAVIDALDRSLMVNRVSKEGVITSVNEHLIQTTGYSEQELIGENPRILNSGYHDKEFFRDLWDTIQAGQIWHGLIRNKGKDGRLIWMKTVITPFQDPNGNVTEYLVFRTDVTEEISLKEQLLESEEMNRSILNSVEEQMAVLDPRGELIAVNKAWADAPEDQRTCLYESEIGIAYMKNRRLSAANDRVPCKLLIDAMDKLKSSGSKNQHFEFEAPFPSGTKWFAVKLSQLSEKTDHTLLTIADITEREQARISIERTSEMLEKEVAKRTAELSSAKAALEQRNFDVISSIEYASRITNAILPSLQQLKAQYPDHFVITKPRDILGGDFVWWGEKNNLTAIAAVDCTGHGVPGALMSIIATQLLNETMEHMDWRNPGMVLSVLNQRLILLLENSAHKKEIADGMDMALCVVDKRMNMIHTAGAYRPIYYTDRDGILNEIRGNVFSIGGGSSAYQKTYKTHEIEVKGEMTVYFGSDGYQSQFGGPDDRKFGKRQLRELLADIASRNISLEEQKAVLTSTFDEWKGSTPQTDDVLLIGLKVHAT